MCSEVLGIAPDKMRVLVGDVGGGFGMKTTLYGEDIVCAYCARLLARAGEMDRRAHPRQFLSGDAWPRSVDERPTLALDEDGRISRCACIRTRISVRTRRPPAPSSS
jgi:carbon-monoxide dehydrogenase large subunit